jgi:hypothetical protein
MTCTSVYSAIPIGSDFTVSFDTNLFCDNLVFDEVTSWTLRLVDASVVNVESDIVSFTYASFPTRFNFQQNSGFVQITVPWSVISSYDPDFKGEIYAYLDLVLIGDNIGDKNLVADARVLSISITKSNLVINKDLTFSISVILGNIAIVAPTSVTII